MLLLPTNELHQFALKKLTKEIEAELKKFRTEETLWLRYNSVRDAWSKMLHKGYDDDFLYSYMIKLERAYYEFTR